MKYIVKIVCLLFVLPITLGACGGAVTETPNSTPTPPITNASINLPKTGQTLCYDAAGSVMTRCTTTTAGQDGALQIGVAWPNQRFINNNDGTITDALTGLMWLQDADCIYTQYANFDNDGTAGDGLVSWQHALDFIAGINTGAYRNCGAGRTDWRLPNRNELRSLANYGQSDSSPWLNAQGFRNVHLIYWTSSTYFNNASYAWHVNINGFTGHGFLKASGNVSVWPVRSTGYASTAPAAVPKTGQTTSYDDNTVRSDDGALQQGVAWPNPRFTTNTDSSVTDNLTGLIWASNAGTPTFSSCSSGAKTWQGALDYVACLNTNNYLNRSDWRLPNINELASLVHIEYTKETACGGPCVTNAAWLNTQGFNNAQAFIYWASTTLTIMPNYGFCVNMYDGDVGYNDKTSYSFYVWPVRGGQ